MRKPYILCLGDGFGSPETSAVLFGRYFQKIKVPPPIGIKVSERALLHKITTVHED
jgi:hypothetical protein